MTREEAIEANKNLLEYMKITNKQEPDCQFSQDNISALDMAIKALEQKPKTGHWILTDVERDRIWRCNCSECGKDPQDYICGSEDWWLIYGNLPKFCPNCGAKMIEAHESEVEE